MRRGWISLCCLAVFSAAAALAAKGAGSPDAGPSLEYRPPRPVLPEPKGPTPAPPVTIFRESFGSFGIGKGSFDKPIDVALGANGRIYVLDAGNNRVQVFNKNNDFVLEWGSYGTDESRCEFKNPSAIAVIPDLQVDCANASAGTCEVIVVVDTGNNRIQFFRVPVTRDPLEKLPNFPCGHVNSIFHSFLPDSLSGSHGSLGEYGIGYGRFDRPLDITFGEDGSLWILDAGNERIQNFPIGYDRTKNLTIGTISEISNLSGARGNLKGLVSLAWSQEGSFNYLYLLGTGCSIQKFKLFNLPVLDETWPAVAPESGLCVPARVRYDSKKEYVYVLDSGNSLLSIFHRSGNFISAMRGADRTFDAPRGFTFRPESGEFAVADTGNDLVQKFTQR